jgi:ribosomal protein S18 acetylase RimI-like enzyme
VSIKYRIVTNQDIPHLAEIRAKNSQTQYYWNNRIGGYVNDTHGPQQALQSRIVFVASDNDTIVGFIAGHLTKRYECQGELQWIDVIENYRRRGIASELVRLLAQWFIERESYAICIDPGNETARKFYETNGAKALNKHWMYWSDIRFVFDKEEILR